MCVLVTSLSKELFSPDNVVKSYFDRWPMQELNFKNLKSRVNIHRIVGYGKKMVDNTPVLGKIERLQRQIQGLEHALVEPLHHISMLDTDFRKLFCRHNTPLIILLSAHIFLNEEIG